jgi:hypothetical protein
VKAATIHIQFMVITPPNPPAWAESIEPTLEPGEDTALSVGRYRVSLDKKRWVVIDRADIWTYFELRTLIDGGQP